METLIKQVAQARRRLMLVRFLTALAWCWTAGLLVAAVAIAAAKLFPIGGGANWGGVWISGALAAGLLAAGIWTWIVRPDPLLAAIELDHRFALRERVSSALALSPAELQTEIGQALVNDAVPHVPAARRVAAFRCAAATVARLTAGGCAVGVRTDVFFRPRVADCRQCQFDQPGRSAANPAVGPGARPQAGPAQEEADEKGLKDAGDLFQKIEEGTKDLASKSTADRKDALVKLNDLAKDLESRRQKIGGTEQLKQQLKEIKDPSDGPADKLAQDVKNGNFDKALEEVKKLQNELANDKLDAKQREDLANQLKSLQDAMNKLADKHDAQQKALQKQIDQLKNAGQMAEAQRLQRQLDQLQQQQPQMQQLKQMAQQLGQCSKCLGQGKPGEGQARQALGDMARDMEQLKQEGDELKMLDQALDQIADAKQSMCQGQGDKPGDGKGQGQGDGLGPGGWDPREGDKMVGQAPGSGGGRASGRRPSARPVRSSTTPRLARRSARAQPSSRARPTDRTSRAKFALRFRPKSTAPATNRPTR